VALLYIWREYARHITSLFGYDNYLVNCCEDFFVSFVLCPQKDLARFSIHTPQKPFNDK